MVLTDLLRTGVPLATPLLLASLGEIIAERAGVINVGIEGMVLAGALAGFAGSYAAHSSFIGAVSAAIAGVLLAGLFGLLAIRLRADQVVVGTAINILALGLTGVFARALFPNAVMGAVAFRSLPIPLLHRLPVVGGRPLRTERAGLSRLAPRPALLVFPLSHPARPASQGGGGVSCRR